MSKRKAPAKVDTTRQQPITREIVRDENGLMVAVRDVKPDAHVLTQLELDAVICRYVEATYTETAEAVAEAVAREAFAAGVQAGIEAADAAWQARIADAVSPAWQAASGIGQRLAAGDACQNPEHVGRTP
jgi:hypothetical protein